MSRLDADVIIVGAGPAGSLTALLLARAGVDVMLLERAVFPRAKPCGDCLSAGTGALLARHGLLAGVKDLPHARLAGWRIFSPSGAHFAAAFADAHAIAVERMHFDHCLVSAACASGARLIEHAHVLDVRTAADTAGVTVSSGAAGTGRDMTARFIAGADGLRSIVARRLGAVERRPRIRKFSLTMHISAQLPFDSFGEMHVATGVCIGVAPLTGDRARWNVTVVGDTRRFGRTAAADRFAFVKSALDSAPGTRGRIPDSCIRDGLAGVLASGPFDVPANRISFPGAALVGDAAGYFDPFTGQGVHHGMAGAELLASDLATALDGGARVPLLRDYPVRARSLTLGARRLQRLIDAVLGAPALANSAIRRLARAPGAAQTLLDVTADMQPARALLAPAVAFDFVFPARRSTQ